MKVAVFSAKDYDRDFLNRAAQGSDCDHHLSFFEARLDPGTVTLADGQDCICAFVNDCLDRSVLEALAKGGTRLVGLRCAGFNNVDLVAALELDIAVARVPAYSPQAVAEHTVALILSLNRKIHRAYARVREGNFALDGLLGFNLAGRTVGIVGTGQIGMAFAAIIRGFGCRVLAHDPNPDKRFEQLGGDYVAIEKLFEQSDIISLHCPLTPQTHHLIDSATIERMKPGVMLINTSRGAVVDTKALISALKSGKIGHLGLDVYEEEGDFFFENLSNKVITDDVFARLLTFPNTLITGHQGFFTREAMDAIASTTIGNISSFETTGSALHPISLDEIA